jgi:hypothetical protein
VFSVFKMLPSLGLKNAGKWRGAMEDVEKEVEDAIRCDPSDVPNSDTSPPISQVWIGSV